MTRLYIIMLTVCWMMVNQLMGAEANGNRRPLARSFGAAEGARQFVPISSSPFGHRPYRQEKKVSRAPTFGMPNLTPSPSSCSELEPTQTLEKIKAEAELTQKLEKIKGLMVIMGDNGIKSELKLDELLDWIKESGEPLVEADKIGCGQLLRIEAFAKSKYEELKYLLEGDGFEEQLLVELDSLKSQQEQISDPVSFVQQLRELSSSIYQKTSDRLEVKRLESALYEAVSNELMTFEDFSDVICTLDTKKQIMERLDFLKISCRDLLRHRSATPSPVRFSPEPPEILIYSASPVQMLEMHGENNKWFGDKLSRGPSPEGLIEGRDSAVSMAEEK